MKSPIELQSRGLNCALQITSERQKWCASEAAVHGRSLPRCRIKLRVLSRLQLGFQGLQSEWLCVTFVSQPGLLPRALQTARADLGERWLLPGPQPGIGSMKNSSFRELGGIRRRLSITRLPSPLSLPGCCFISLAEQMEPRNSAPLRPEGHFTWPTSP